MPRTARASVGGICYHAINRGNNRARIYHADRDYEGFIELMVRACRRIPMRVPGFCLMPNHFHLVLWPYGDGDLSRWMQWLLTSHVRRYHSLRGTTGRVWQGRFKAFPIQDDAHFLTVLRYVERNPLRAGLVEQAHHWPWSSLSTTRSKLNLPNGGPLKHPPGWTAYVNTPVTPAEMEAVRQCVSRDAPYGDPNWAERTAKQLGLEASMRPKGRPKTPEQ